MSLNEEGTGILKTHVHWEDIQKHLYKSLGSNAKLGNDAIAHDITDINGFTSKMTLVHTDFADETLPKKIIVKILSLTNANENAKKIDPEKGNFFSVSEDKVESEIEVNPICRYHNLEVDAYNRFNTIKDEIYPIVKVYASQAITPPENYNKGFLIMEYVENVEPIHLDVFFDERLMSEVLRATAKVNASIKYMNEEEIEKCKMNTFSDCFRPLLEKKFVRSFYDSCRLLIGEEHLQKLADIEQILFDITEEEHLIMLDKTTESLGMKPVFLHGDLWTNNIILLKNEKNQLNLRALIDFQASHVGNLGHDVARLLCSVLPAENFEELFEKYVKEYYTYLVEYCSPETMPGTFEQISEAIYKLLPISAHIMLGCNSMLYILLLGKRKDPELAKKLIKNKVLVLIEIIHKYYNKYYEKN